MVYRHARNVVLAAVIAAATGAFAADPVPATNPAPALAAIGAKVKPSLVVVEYTLRYDKGEAPYASGFMDRCPSCGRFHVNGAEDVIKEERAVERRGYMVDKRTVVTLDPAINPRFVAGIAVRTLDGDAPGATRVAAKISAVANTHNAVFLTLDGDLAGTVPATFGAGKDAAKFTVTPNLTDGRWAVVVKPFSGTVTLGAKASLGADEGLVVDANGAAVALATDGEFAADEDWSGSPTKWAKIDEGKLAQRMKDVETLAQGSVVHVTLHFRSPNAGNARRRYESEAMPTQLETLGVVLPNKQLLVLSDLKPNITARLERIRVRTEPPREATFKASLSDYGAIVAELKEATGTPAKLSAEDITKYRMVATPAVDVRILGEKRVSHVQMRRIAGFDIGWQRRIYPTVPGEDRNALFLFDNDNALLSLPMKQRAKVAVQERYGGDRDKMVPATELAAVLANLPKGTDSGNVPLSEKEESRVAWVGVELQAMDAEVARANNVSDLTNNGETGALVAYVHPNSPAAKAGVEVGMVLLRIEAEGQPKPIDVKIENDYERSSPFPWDQLGEAPEQVFDRIPTPWADVETSFVRTITDLGFDKKFTMELANDGKTFKKEFTVTQSPEHWGSATRFKHTGMGVTVRDVTFEVRRYLQMKPEDPGVVISKIEMGSKGSIAGLKPFEVITHVNEKPIMSTKDFDAATKDQRDLRFSVKRAARGRIVKLQLAGTTAPAGTTSAPATSTAPASTTSAPAPKLPPMKEDDVAPPAPE